MESDVSTELEQRALLKIEEYKCEVKKQTEVIPSGLHCPITFDGVVCWPYVPAGHNVFVPCPSYIHGFNLLGNASRLCTVDGEWWINEKTNSSWSNYTECITKDEEEFILLNTSVFQPHIHTIKTIAKVGYSVSFITLIVAATILASVRRLRCPRNKLHLQLFLSFIVRGFMFLLKDALYGYNESNGDHSDTNEPSSESLSLINDPAGGLQVDIAWDNSIQCKIFTSFWQYSLMANYSLILMEGLYLHNLIFLSMFTDASGIARYVIAGWGIPLLFILPWVIVRALLDNNLCWTTNEITAYFWIIRGPITLSIVVNFALFLNITRVLFSKLFAAQAPQARHYRYRKWFKSTLVLVPLFGVHYALLLAMALAADIGVGEMTEVVWLYADVFFSSFQGSVVAFLYCFLNGEVRSELKKMFPNCPRKKEFGDPRGGERDRSFHSNSICTQSLTLLSRAGRCSIQSLQSSSQMIPNAVVSNFQSQSQKSPGERDREMMTIMPNFNPGSHQRALNLNEPSNITKANAAETKY